MIEEKFQAVVLGAGESGVGAALDLLGGLGVEPGGAVELAGHGDSSRGAGTPATTRGFIVSRAGSPSPTGSLPADGGGGRAGSMAGGDRFVGGAG